MERLHRLCRNVSTRRARQRVHSSQQGVGIRKPIQKGVESSYVSKVCWNPYSKGKIDEPKVGQDNHIRNFRVGGSTVRGAAGTRSRHQNSVSQHGSAGSILNGSQRRDCHGAERGARGYLARRRNLGFGTARL